MGDGKRCCSKGGGQPSYAVDLGGDDDVDGECSKHSCDGSAGTEICLSLRVFFFLALFGSICLYSTLFDFVQLREAFKRKKTETSWG